MKDPAKDPMTEEGANRLARTIRKYWRRKGKAPVVTVHPGGTFKEMRGGETVETPFWVVRSNMIGGVPPHA